MTPTARSCLACRAPGGPVAVVHARTRRPRAHRGGRARRRWPGRRSASNYHDLLDDDLSPESLPPSPSTRARCRARETPTGARPPARALTSVPGAEPRQRLGALARTCNRRGRRRRRRPLPPEHGSDRPRRRGRSRLGARAGDGRLPLPISSAAPRCLATRLGDIPRCGSSAGRLERPCAARGAARPAAIRRGLPPPPRSRALRVGATNSPWRHRAWKVLFAGESGTGKTMAPGVIAGDLGLDLFRVDLATVVSKYVGDTEKNLDRIFAAAEGATPSCSSTTTTRCSASAPRSKTRTIATRHRGRLPAATHRGLRRRRHPHDQPARQHGRYVLASTRRLVEFPFPEALTGAGSGSGLVPAAAPVADDVDLDVLADRFRAHGWVDPQLLRHGRLSCRRRGGCDRDAAPAAAVAQELRKQGRLTLEADFAGLGTPA